MRNDQVVRRLRAWQEGRPLPAYDTRHFPIVPAEHLMVLTIVKMGGESAPWGIMWGHPDGKRRAAVVPEPRNRDAVAQMVATFAPDLLDHFCSPVYYDWKGESGPKADLPLRQLWMPNDSSIDMLHFLAYAYTFTRYGDDARVQLLNSFGRLVGWLFREAHRPGEVVVMSATDALRRTYVFPAEDVRQAHLGYLLAWLETRGGRDKRLAAATAAEALSVSTSLDPVLERDKLAKHVEVWNDVSVSSGRKRAASDEITTILEGELGRRFDLTLRAIKHLSSNGLPINAGVLKLIKESRKEHWLQYVRVDLRLSDDEDGPAFVPSPETDRSAPAAASRYFVQAASEEFLLAALIHDDEKLQEEVIFSGDGVRGEVRAVWDEGNNRITTPVWAIRAQDDIPLRIREGSNLCLAGASRRVLRVRSIEREGIDELTITAELIKGKSGCQREDGRQEPHGMDRGNLGRRIVLLPAPADGIARLKSKNVWPKDNPGSWITHSLPGGRRSRLPKEIDSGGRNLFEETLKL